MSFKITSVFSTSFLNNSSVFSALISMFLKISSVFSTLFLNNSSVFLALLSMFLKVSSFSFPGYLFHIVVLNLLNFLEDLEKNQRNSYFSKSIWTSQSLINQEMTRDNTRLAYITIISDTPQPTLQDQS